MGKRNQLARSSLDDALSRRRRRERTEGVPGEARWASRTALRVGAFVV